MKTNIAAAHHPVSSFRSMRSWTTLLFLLTFLSAPLVAQVHFERKPDRVDVQINGKPFTTLHYGKDVGKPYLHPLISASGKAVTRGFPHDPLPGDSVDRPHLRGVIVGVEKLSAPSGGVQDFWENDPAPFYRKRIKGNIVLQEVNTADGADHGTLSMVAHWFSKQGQLWIIERRTMTFYTKPADSRMFDIDLQLEAANEDVTFLDDKDAILGIRLGLPFDTHYDGRLVNAIGGINEAGARGQRAPWVDWVGDVQGEKIGVAVFDHPSNRNYPNRWHIRDFAQINVGPFGGKVFQEYASSDNKVYRDDWTLTLKRGEKLNLKYRILIHPAEGPAAGDLLSDMEKLLDLTYRPLVDQRVYDCFNQWRTQK
ncbi:MAG: PmoA family protein [Acidobacteriia bacterium]|nr:PmoA family protein [Terriglobia bacterium]